MSALKQISVLEVFDLRTGKRRTVREFNAHIEAPNWFPDGKRLLYNSDGRVFSYDMASGESTLIYTGQCIQCNNDHVLSRDGKLLAISSGSKEEPQSRIWILQASGGEPDLVTENAPSYLHGLSPDGTTLAYCAQRNGNYDVYTIRLDGKAHERRLTDAAGLDDGPEYSPDGKYIWFNSVRTGLMQIWRMRANGDEQMQMTFDIDRNSWFPHISPDGKKVVFISYKKGDVDPGDHPANRNVEIHLMDADGGSASPLVSLFGGQGTLNVNSWNPESNQFAFISYQSM